MQNKIDLKNFQIEKILSRDDDKKIIVFLGVFCILLIVNCIGKFKDSIEPGILILDKKSFPANDKVSSIITCIEKTEPYFEV